MEKGEFWPQMTSKSLIFFFFKFELDIHDYVPKNSLKSGVIGQFQANPAEYKNRDVLQSINTIKVQF